MGRKQRCPQEGTGQGCICALEVQGGHEGLYFCLSPFPRHNSQGLRVVLRVKTLAFPGDFSQACIPGQSVDHKPPLL